MVLMGTSARFVLLAIFSVTLVARAPAQVSASQDSRAIVIDASAQAQPFPHFWEQMFGSGRAILSLRESYRNDLRDVKKITGFEYARFHAIFHDEVGIYDEDAQGHPLYNFSYVDQIYDGLLANGVRPFVELSFMPKALAEDKNAIHPFWYKQNVSPPKDWNKWDDLVTQFTKHLVDRYGIDEVSQWYFEVWNEPNLDFWAGDPKQATYFELYDHTARAEGSKPAVARRRARHGPGGLGRRVYPSLRGEQGSRGLRLVARVRKRQVRRCVWHA
jgi:xylan 1,4-beta-xylosidase